MILLSDVDRNMLSPEFFSSMTWLKGRPAIVGVDPRKVKEEALSAVTLMKPGSLGP